MQFKDTATRSTIKRVVEVEREGAPVLPMEYSRDNKKFRVERIVIEYKWKDGLWVVDSYVSVEMTGTVLKRDGSDSKNTTTRSPIYGWQRDPGMYPWLSKIVDLLRPTTEMILATGSFEVPWEDEG